ncbi:restriction endonuclease subunit S [Yaniella halotolerans]|uniref:restriction endonuclease subunit S n=1 Tax=Yaniella halotolerans TaxID=225453 RepID=UPI0003B53238|nr:restriction endonuclease subunit S [Yaniella halotolerans]
MSWSWKPAALGITPRHDLPSGWKVARVGDLAHLINGQPYDSKFFGQEGVPLIRIRDILGGSIETRYSGAPLTSRRVQYGDLLIGMDGDFNTGRWEHSEPGLLNQRVLAVEASAEISSWFGYCLPEPLTIINDLKYSTTVKHLSSKDVASIRIPLPGNTDLLKLLYFLDRETAEIDAFIADQERLIELLEERRAATITHAVTKGLDPNAPMKDSGLEWVGQIPEHWRMMPIKRVASIRGRIGFRGYTTADLVDEGSGAIALSPGNMRAGRLRWQDSTYISWEKYFESPEIVVSSGDTLLVKTGSTFGKTAYVELSEKSHVTINPQIVILRPYNMDGYFFHCAISNSRVHNEFRSYPTGGTTPTMTESRIGSIEIAVPDYKEQRAIADFLKREAAELDAAVADAREAIVLSRERRAALISAAVTGQLDVSQARRPVEEVLEDEVRV